MSPSECCCPKRVTSTPPRSRPETCRELLAWSPDSARVTRSSCGREAPPRWHNLCALRSYPSCSTAALRSAVVSLRLSCNTCARWGALPYTEIVMSWSERGWSTSPPLATPFPDLPKPTQKFGDEGGDARFGDGGVHEARRDGGASPGGSGGGAMDTGGESSHDAKRAKTAPRAGDAMHFTASSASHASPATEPAVELLGGRAYRRRGDGDSGPDASRSFAAPMSTGGGSFSSGGPPGAGLDRPALTMVDAAYLRKRKLALDDAFLAASQDIEIERVGAE